MPSIIQNWRMDFATNSSSNHSLVLLKKDGKFRSAVPYSPKIEDQQYGWENFILHTVPDKLRYLACQLSTVEDARNICQRLAIDEYFPPMDGYVDHESQLIVPAYRNNLGWVHLEYLQALKTFLLREDSAVLGGNDNEDDLFRGVLTIQHRLMCSKLGFAGDSRQAIVAAGSGTHWTLFNQNNGYKVHVSFDGSPFVKSGCPELVDLKITDYCRKRCAYCYQKSSRAGAHMKYQRYGVVDSDIISALIKSDVLEVCLGGGEPVRSPFLSEIVDVLSEEGIRASLATRDQPELLKTGLHVRDRLSAYAVSVNVRKDVERLISDPKLRVNYVMGTGDLAEVARECALRKFPLILLGPKTPDLLVPAREEGCQWRKTLQKAGINYVGVDTAFVNTFDMTGISKYSYYRTEGAFSCYVDGVSQQMGRDSYSGDLVPFDSKTWLDVYQTY